MKPASLLRGADEIRSVLQPRPHACLSIEPTPIHLLGNISARFGRPVYILREDLTGFGIGGNKVRKLDYLIGEALQQEADTLVTTAASSFSRNAAAAAAARGLALHVLIAGTLDGHNQSSRDLFAQYGATIHYQEEAGDEAVDKLVEALRCEGRTVYTMPPGGSTETGALGYVHVFEQIVRDSAAEGIHFERIVLPTGSAGTQAGLVIGQCISGYSTRVHGMAISQPSEVQRQRVIHLAESTSQMLKVVFDPTTVTVDDRFLGAGYPRPSKQGRAAVDLFARMEGLQFDQVYMGKAAAGLVHLMQTDEIEDGQATLLIHTGGNGGIYY